MTRPADIPQNIWEQVGLWVVSDRTREDIARALLAAEARGKREGMEMATQVAREREAICEDACDQVKAGSLYVDVPNAFATENSARLEAGHIARLIEAKAQEIEQ